MKKYSFLIICTLLTGLLFTTCEPWIVPEAVFVNFNANGGQGDMKAQRFEKGIISQQLSSNEFTRTGYVFVGWNTRADGKGTSYADMEMAEIKKSVTLYAQWSMIYKVHFNANGATGTMAAQTFVAGVAQTIAANTFTRSGYTFTGWNTKADGRGTSYTDKQPITLWQDITLYAQWKKDIVNYTVTFNANGGTGTMAAQTFEAGVSQAITANTFTRSGYTFTGWNTKADGSGTSYTDKQSITLSQDITLYAQWEQEQVVSGTESGHDYVDLGLPSGLKWATCNVGATTPEGYGDYFAWGETEPKEDYSWNNYSYCKGSHTTLTKYNTKSDYGTVDNKTTLELTDDAARANWGGEWRMPTTAEQDELRNNCTWTWTTQNGVNGYTVTSKTNGNSIFLPAAGYRSGTSVNSVGSRGRYCSGSLGESYPYSAYSLYFDSGYVGWGYSDRYYGHTVRAVCGNNTATQTFTLTFNANGGTGTMAAQTFEAGVSQAIAANAFTRSGYTFTGWNTKADGSGNSYTNKQIITLTQDITLYAQWEQEQEQVVSGTENGHDYVDLGLPSGLKWATCNVGATTPEGYGDYFAWGETASKTNYDWSTYKYCNGSPGALTKYNTKTTLGTVDNKTILELTDDAARVNWGGKWRMPTKAEQDELNTNCTSTWTTQNGVNGYKVTSKINGKSIFLPAAGYKDGASVIDVGENSRYWPSSLYVTNPTCAYFSSIKSSSYGSRSVGRTVRAVFSDNDKPSTFVTLTFNANGGSGTMAAQAFEPGVSQAIAANTFTRDGYIFTGWNTKADGSGTSYTDKQSITISQNITLYAQWKKRIKYNLSFNANGGEGTMSAQTFEEGVSQAITANTFTRSGYTFIGWNTAPDGSGAAYADGQSITLTQDITLYAQWEQEQVVSGTENGHDYVDLGLPSGLKWATCNVGATTPEAYGDYFAWGETSPKSNYTWETYKFRTSGDSNANVKFNKYNTSSDYGTVDNKTTLELTDDAARVNWGGTWRMPTKVEQDELRNNCTWTWTTQNGVNGYKVTSKTNGNSIFLPAAGYRPGTSGDGVGSSGQYWSSSLRESYPYNAYYLRFYSGNVEWYSYHRCYGRTVRAVFFDNDKPSTFVTLTFNANGGTGTMAAQTFEAGVSQAIAANAFTRSGYTFTGWNTNADGSGTSYTDKQSITISQDITLYAQWKKGIVNYTVTFNANGGTGTMAAQTFEAGVSQAIKANTFTRDGYSFAGWNTAADGSGTSYKNVQVITLTQNMTLYAQWFTPTYVDLGLSVKWATCNVGAASPEGYGDYFAWGETSPKDDYSWSTYKYCNGSSSTLTKYNTNSSNGTVDNKTTLELSDDAARVNWGGKWRMPTKAEQDELRNNCTWTWTTQSGVNGYKVTSKTNGNSIFLPAAGYRGGTSVNYAGSRGGYWSSSLYESNPKNAYIFYFDSGFLGIFSSFTRYDGHAVRAVCP